MKEDKQEMRETVDNMSDFCRVNNQNSFTYVSKTLHGFVLGPHNFSEATPVNGELGPSIVQNCPSMKNFAPIVYMKDAKTGEMKPYRLMVYIGHKTMLALLMEVDFEFDYDFLSRLDAHLAKHAPIIS